MNIKYEIWYKNDQNMPTNSAIYAKTVHISVYTNDVHALTRYFTIDKSHDFLSPASRKVVLTKWVEDTIYEAICVDKVLEELNDKGSKGYDTPRKPMNDEF